MKQILIIEDDQNIADLEKDYLNIEGLQADIKTDGAAGIFLAASQFPRNRETRAPFVDELIPHQNEIDPKYGFLMHAPVKDPDGRRSMVRFARKTKEQYVMTEVEKRH